VTTKEVEDGQNNHWKDDGDDRKWDSRDKEIFQRPSRSIGFPSIHPKE
jgi:hypothetical protein